MNLLDESAENEKPILFFWCGFASTEKEWKPVFEKMPFRRYWVPVNPHPEGFWGYAKHFLDKYSAFRGKITGFGYSMGARLLLHIHILDPGFFRSVIVSGPNLGLATVQEKCVRWESDRHWAQRFREEDFEEVWTAWNSQDVFKGSSSLPFPKSLNPMDLSILLEEFSLARQDDLRPMLFGDAEKIEETNARVLWVVGERDSKFLDQYKELPIGVENLIVVPQSGHRVHADQSQSLSLILTELHQSLG